MNDDRTARILAWLHEASNPYWDWLWGSLAQAQLNDWLHRPSSELSEKRVRDLMDGDEIVGGYIAFPCSELQECRKSDLLSIMNVLRHNSDAQIMSRMREARSLFSHVEENDFYLSRIGVAPSARRGGLGRRLLEMFLREGRDKGFSRFRLDVSADNERAIRLYRAAGFDVISDSAIPNTPIRYLSMVTVVAG
jgi:GNAT superfamily N-acetyltransferase